MYCGPHGVCRRIQRGHRGGNRAATGGLLVHPDTSNRFANTVYSTMICSYLCQYHAYISKYGIIKILSYVGNTSGSYLFCTQISCIECTPLSTSSTCTPLRRSFSSSATLIDVTPFLSRNSLTRPSCKR